MPCCCKDNVTASLVIGIVLAILSLVSIAGLTLANIASGVIGALMQCFPIFGAYKRNRTLILVWMIFAILQCT